MADSLTGMPISTLPTTSLQQSDQLIAYREDTGKAYRSNVGALGEASEANISDAFSETKTYSAGDYVIYEDTLYVFVADKEAGEWDSEAVEKTSVGTEVGKLGDQVTELSSALVKIQTDIYRAESGDIAQSAYTDISITFQEEFESVPAILLSFQAGTNLNYGSVALAATSVKTTGFNLRIINNTTISTLTPVVRWLAIV